GTGRACAGAALPRHARGSRALGADARGVDVGRGPPVPRGLPPSRRARLQASLEDEDVAVRRALDALVERKLLWPVDDHEAARPGFLERGDGLVRREMPTQAVATFP